MYRTYFIYKIFTNNITLLVIIKFYSTFKTHITLVIFKYHFHKQNISSKHTHRCLLKFMNIIFLTSYINTFYIFNIQIIVNLYYNTFPILVY